MILGDKLFYIFSTAIFVNFVGLVFGFIRHVVGVCLEVSEGSPASIINVTSLHKVNSEVVGKK